MSKSVKAFAVEQLARTTTAIASLRIFVLLFDGSGMVGASWNSWRASFERNTPVTRASSCPVDYELTLRHLFTAPSNYTRF
jgi:hypothetical protein